MKIPRRCQRLREKIFQERRSARGWQHYFTKDELSHIDKCPHCKRAETALGYAGTASFVQNPVRLPADDSRLIAAQRLLRIVSLARRKDTKESILFFEMHLLFDILLELFPNVPNGGEDLIYLIQSLLRLAPRAPV